MPEESISDFSIESQAVTYLCDSSCVKSTADTLLRLQFIRGPMDSEIRTKLQQTDYDKMFEELINFAVTIELSENETYTMSLN